MLQGRQYSRGIRAIKLVHEALFRMFFTSMLTWCESQGKTVQSPELIQKVEQLHALFQSKQEESALRLMEEVEE